MQRAVVSGVAFGYGRRAVIAVAIVMLSLLGLGYGPLPAEAAQAVAQFRVGIRIVPVKHTETLTPVQHQRASSALARTTATNTPPLPRKRPARLIPVSLSLPSAPASVVAPPSKD